MSNNLRPFGNEPLKRTRIPNSTFVRCKHTFDTVANHRVGADVVLCVVGFFGDLGDGQTLPPIFHSDVIVTVSTRHARRHDDYSPLRIR